MTHRGSSADLPRAYPLLLRLFGATIARRRLRGAFRAVRMLHGDRLRTLPAGPTVVYLNHPSWWDPLVCMQVARRLLPSRLHRAPISDASLKQYPIFRLLGAFPVEQNSRRGAAQFLNASQAILRAGGVLWITAEGHFTDVRTRPTRLMPGLGALLHRNEHVTVVPMALEYTFWDQRLPEVLAAFGEPVHVTRLHERSSADWTSLLEVRLEAVQDELAAAALTRDRSRFTTLLEGKRGTSGFYGMWQRLRGRLRGNYQADHEGESRAGVARPVAGGRS